jgi:hypothetical protein
MSLTDVKKGERPKLKKGDVIATVTRQIAEDFRDLLLQEIDLKIEMQNIFARQAKLRFERERLWFRIYDTIVNEQIRAWCGEMELDFDDNLLDVVFCKWDEDKKERSPITDIFTDALEHINCDHGEISLPPSTSIMYG